MVTSSLLSSNQHPQGFPILPTPVLTTGTYQQQPYTIITMALLHGAATRGGRKARSRISNPPWHPGGGGGGWRQPGARMKRSKRTAFRVGFLICFFTNVVLAIAQVFLATEQRYHDASQFLGFGLRFLICLMHGVLYACTLVGLSFSVCLGTTKCQRLVHRLVAGIDKELARKMQALDDDGGGPTVLNSIVAGFLQGCGLSALTLIFGIMFLRVTSSSSS
jgi:hypothetical protein